MLTRCYKPNHSTYLRYGAKGVTVVKEWHDFQCFAVWYNQNFVEGWHIDKDLLAGDTLQYGPETCVFLPHDLHHTVTALLCPRQGWKRSGSKYMVQVHDGTEKVYYGTFETKEEAHSVYISGVWKKIDRQLSDYNLPRRAVDRINSLRP